MHAAVRVRGIDEHFGQNQQSTLIPHPQQRRDEGQKWQVAAGGLEHAALLLERYAGVEGSPFGGLVHGLLLDLAGALGARVRVL